MELLKKFLSKCRNWLKESNRSKHLFYAIFIGLGADSAYCSIFAGVGIASALEFKDKAWGGKWDWIDWCLTTIGVIIGYGIKLLLTLALTAIL